MGIIDRIRQRSFEELDKMKNRSLAELVKEQSLKDLLVKREFRISQGYLQREFLDRAQDEEIVELTITLLDGFGEIKGRIKKRFVPFTIPFSVTFSLGSVEFTTARKQVLLKLEQVTPLDVAWITRKFVEKIPFLSLSGDFIACDLTRVPRLAELFAYRVKSVNPWDHVTLKELTLSEGEIVGRVGVVL
jgi:hypothetical protein